MDYFFLPKDWIKMNYGLREIMIYGLWWAMKCMQCLSIYEIVYFGSLFNWLIVLLPRQQLGAGMLEP